MLCECQTINRHVAHMLIMQTRSGMTKDTGVQLESYIGKHSEAVFSHGICPECEKKAYEDLDKFLKKDN